MTLETCPTCGAPAHRVHTQPDEEPQYLYAAPAPMAVIGSGDATLPVSAVLA